MQHKWKQIVGLVALYAVGVLFLILTNPGKLPILFLLFPFVYFFGLLYLTARLIMGVRYQGMANRVIVVLVAAVPVLLLTLASIHQLTIKDVLLCIIIVGILAWYLIKIRQL